jgi:hypothetical protein
MLMRWIWRFLVMFVGRKAWEAYRRRGDRAPAAAYERPSRTGRRA